MVEAVFLVASQNTGRVEVIALGFDEAECVAVIDRDGANGMAAHPTLPIIYVATYNVPCFLLLVDDDGGDGEPTTLLSANYGDGTLSALRLQDGHVVDISSRLSFGCESRPGTHPLRQNGSHPHWVGRDGDLLVTDLGNDVIHEVSLHAGRLLNRGVHRKLPRGSGPRHVCRDSTGGLWVSLELSNGVSRLGPDAIATSSSSNRWLPDDVAGNHVGDIAFEPEADVVVTANRDVNTLGIFTRGRDGIEPVAEIDCGGEWPTQFAQQDGTFAVANRESGTVAIFDVGPSWWENSPEIFDVVHPVGIIAAPLWMDDL